MKALHLALRILVAGLLLVALAFASYRAGFNARCDVGNMTVALPPDKQKAVHDGGFGWANRAVMCSMGDYQVVTSNEPGHKVDLFIIRKAEPFLLVNDNLTDLLDDSGEHVLFSLTRNIRNGVSGITYSAYNEEKGAWIENFDLRADGTLDSRTTEINGRKVKEEYRVGEQWLERLQRDGRTGVVFNGQFMPVADAIKLSEKPEAK